MKVEKQTFPPTCVNGQNEVRATIICIEGGKMTGKCIFHNVGHMQAKLDYDKTVYTVRKICVVEAFYKEQYTKRILLKFNSQCNAFYNAVIQWLKLIRDLLNEKFIEEAIMSHRVFQVHQLHFQTLKLHFICRRIPEKYQNFHSFKLFELTKFPIKCITREHSWIVVLIDFL